MALRQKGLMPFASSFASKISPRDCRRFYADVLVENKVLLELKAASRIMPEHKAQVINYLKATGIEVGLLINFGNAKLEYNRLHK